MAFDGAEKAVGLDPKSELLNFASENLRRNYPQLTNIVEFKDLHLKHYDDEVIFDYIVSKSTLEHITLFGIVFEGDEKAP